MTKRRKAKSESWPTTSDRAAMRATARAEGVSYLVIYKRQKALYEHIRQRTGDPGLERAIMAAEEAEIRCPTPGSRRTRRKRKLRSIPPRD